MTFLIQQTLIYAVPLMIVALAGVFAERSGIINLALEGIMLFGAFIGVLFVRLMQGSQAVLAAKQAGDWVALQGLELLTMLVAAAMGAVFSLLLSFASINLRADQTIGGTALNLMAPALVLFLIRIIANQNTLQMATGDSASWFMLKKSTFGVDKNVDWGFFGETFLNKIYLATYICILLFIILSVILYKTKFGLRLRACGENPQAADSLGINVYKMRYAGVTISGALAGMGGFVYAMTTANCSSNGDVAGFGFLALAVMIFGNWKPLNIAGASLLFGLFKCIAAAYASIDINGDGVFLLADIGISAHLAAKQAGDWVALQGLELLTMLVAAAMGAVFSLLLSFASINLRADQTIGGTALNLMAPALVLFLIRIIANQNTLQMATGDSASWFMLKKSTFGVDKNVDWGFFGETFLNKIYLATYICILLFIILSVILYKTKFGLRLRACGENPQAADSLGINVYKMRYAGVTISGALAGMGGFVYAMTTANCSSNGDVAGFGFLALAVMIFGNWKPLNIAGASLLFGLFKCIAAAYASIDINGDGVFLLADIGISAHLYRMLPYLITLLVLAFTSKKSRAPKAEGIPYDKGQR